VALLRGLLAAALVWALCAVAPAQSAEIVQVRVGNHPTFTRVVFEFDTPTGYRIERHAAGEAENAIVVTLDAASRTRNIASRSRAVESVSVEAEAGRSIARIVTRESGLPIKEMILADPPRVVLDLMFAASQPTVATPEPAAKPTPPAPPKPMVAKPRPATPPPIAPEPEPEPEPVQIAEPEPEPVQIAEPEPEPEPVQIAEPEPAPDISGEAVEIPEAAEAPPVADAESVPEAAPAADHPPETAAVQPRAAEAPERIAAEADEGAAAFDVTMVGAIAAGVLVLLFVIFLLVRRRSKAPGDLDVTTFAPADESADEVASGEARIPQGGFSMDVPAEGAEGPRDDFEFGVSDLPDDENKPIAAAESVSETDHGLFDEAPKQKDATTMENQDLPVTHLDSEAPTQLGIGAASFGAADGAPDFARMMQEFETRIAHLETRLNESIEARETLERQVTAQSEELRVQRAAIARTQRALRSLNRSEEDQATEPALRDPAKPAGSQ
jgi:outer membrane biosynthesis protein TonB